MQFIAYYLKYFTAPGLQKIRFFLSVRHCDHFRAFEYKFLDHVLAILILCLFPSISFAFFRLEVARTLYGYTAYDINGFTYGRKHGFFFSTERKLLEKQEDAKGRKLAPRSCKPTNIFHNLNAIYSCRVLGVPTARYIVFSRLSLPLIVHEPDPKNWAIGIIRGD